MKDGLGLLPNTLGGREGQPFILVTFDLLLLTGISGLMLILAPPPCLSFSTALEESWTDGKMVLYLVRTSSGLSKELTPMSCFRDNPQ